METDIISKSHSRIYYHSNLPKLGAVAEAYAERMRAQGHKVVIRSLDFLKPSGFAVDVYRKSRGKSPQIKA